MLHEVPSSKIEGPVVVDQVWCGLCLWTLPLELRVSKLKDSQGPAVVCFVAPNGW